MPPDETTPPEPATVPPPTVAAEPATPEASAGSNPPPGPVTPGAETRREPDVSQAKATFPPHRRRVEITQANEGYAAAGNLNVDQSVNEGDSFSAKEFHVTNNYHYYGGERDGRSGSVPPTGQPTGAVSPAPPTAEALTVQATLAFVASRAGDLAFNEFVRIADALLVSENASVRRPVESKPDAKEVPQPPTPFELWQSDRAAMLDATGLGVVENRDGRQVICSLLATDLPALTKRFGTRLAVINADAFWRVLEKRLLFDPAERVRRFVRELIVDAADADPGSAGLFLLRTLENAFRGSDYREVYAAAFTADSLWRVDALRDRLKGVCQGLAQSTATCAILALALKARRIPLATRASLVFEALDALDRRHGDLADDDPRLPLIAFLYTRNWQLNDSHSEDWQKITADRFAETPGQSSTYAAFAAAAAAHLFDPVRATTAFVGTLTTLVGERTSAWILANLFVPELRPALHGAFEFLNHDPAANWILAFATDAFAEQRSPADKDSWLQWSQQLPADHAWLSRAALGPRAGLLLLAEWNYRAVNADPSADAAMARRIASFVREMERAPVVEFAGALYHECQRQILELQRESWLTFEEGAWVRIGELSSKERSRLLAPLVARRPHLQRFAVHVRAAPRMATARA